MAGEKEKSIFLCLNDHVTKLINPNVLFKAMVEWIKPKEASATTASCTPDPAPTPPATMPDATDYLPDTLPPFDIGAALGRLNGKKTLLRKLLIKFHDVYINAIPTLNEMMEKGDLEDAARLAHSIKGGAGNLEASDVFESSRLVEMALIEGRIEDVPELILDLEAAMKPAIEACATLKEEPPEGGI